MTNTMGPKLQFWLGINFFLLFFLFPTMTSWSNAALLLLLVTWLLGVKQIQPYETIKHNPILWILTGLVIVVLLGLLYTPAPTEWTSQNLRKYARFFYAVVLATLLIGNRRLQKLALSGFVLAMLFMVASTWLNIWFLLPWSASQVLGWGVSHHVFGDYITQNVMVSFFSVMAFYKFVTTPHPQRWFWLIAALLSAISVTHLSQGRTGIVVLVAGYSALIVGLLHISIKKRILLVFALLVALITLLATSSIIQSRFELGAQELSSSTQDRFSSIGHRVNNYKTTTQMIMDAPIIGHGTGAYHTEICRYLVPGDDCSIFQWHPHNQFLFFGADHGLIGVLLYGGLILWMFRMAFKTSEHKARILMLALASILLFNSMINSPWWSSRESQFFSYMLALAIAMCLPSNRPTNENSADS